MTNRPWMKFSPAAWRANAPLRMVSMGARGLWIEMICLMHDAEPYGHLVVKGKPVTDPALLGQLVGASPADVEMWLEELISAEVAKRKRNGVIFSSRMEEDELKRRRDADNGRQGGNPTLRLTTENPVGVNPQAKPADKAKRLESRDESPEHPSDAASERSDLDVLAARVFDACSEGLREKLGGDPRRIMFELRDFRVREPKVDLDQLATGLAAKMSSAEQLKREPRYQTSPLTLLRGADWVHVLNMREGHGARDLSLAPKPAVPTPEALTSIVVDGFDYDVPESGWRLRPDIAPLKVRDMLEVMGDWEKDHFNPAHWQRGRQGPAPGEPGCRIWPSVLERFNIPALKGDDHG